MRTSATSSTIMCLYPCSPVSSRTSSGHSNSSFTCLTPTRSPAPKTTRSSAREVRRTSCSGSSTGSTGTSRSCGPRGTCSSRSSAAVNLRLLTLSFTPMATMRPRGSNSGPSSGTRSSCSSTPPFSLFYHPFTLLTVLSYCSAARASDSRTS